MVNTNTLAAEMQTRAASVTDMLKKLKAKKLLQYERYRGFRLSEAGKKAALDVVRKHRLWEYFLAEHLKFDWDKVHPIAEELEHISSDELVQRLDNFLGNPSFTGITHLFFPGRTRTDFLTHINILTLNLLIVE